ncbi:hypothetical protein H4219_004992 [Mycoemilia scoparia]|uniref:Uncharacterized protein n=1 Tax=Mycoemilia scoparia TaxID=417184 RepID=A0A9W7ZPQ6_9FUNG|nr:hypothetical protein H4219_004992 [Mycoemilia scoparia]
MGFHELAMFFMLVYNNDESAYRALRSVALFYQRDAMGDSLEPTLYQIAMLFSLVKATTPKLYNFLDK